MLIRDERRVSFRGYDIEDIQLVEIITSLPVYELIDMLVG